VLPEIQAIRQFGEMSTLTTTYRSRQKVLGYPIDLIDEAGALGVIEEAWKNQKSLHVVTLNAEMVVAAQKDRELDRIIRHAHLIVPDGAGVVWALKLAGHQVSRLPGIELAAASLALCARLNCKVALIGGKPEILEPLQKALRDNYPGINIVAAHNGYWSADQETEMVDELSHCEPDLLLVALGVPRQEYFLDRWHQAFPHTVMVGVGGSFDVWTGTVKRAPALFRSLNLEWLYRLLKEPWRFQRMGQALPSFAIQALSEVARKKITEKDNHSGARSPGRSNNNKHAKKKKERSKDT
jgi:N-acetylglucosaminyldiphosphoundecaprenol N-acetyl-beta-D-mannosaminyltransferase